MYYLNINNIKLFLGIFFNIFKMKYLRKYLKIKFIVNKIIKLIDFYHTLRPIDFTSLTFNKPSELITWK